ncbi:MAG: hypothetical protein HYT69_01290 [Candidatus Zambryskibacteria bacterium]|nr:hypothetical protein [Candidatus Zambryskibacteria bacterium]
MTYSREQQQAAYKKLPEEAQNFIMSNETTEFISANLEKYGLPEEQINLADSEILYAMYGLQTLDTAIQKIAEISGEKNEELSSLKADLQENIFSKYKELGVVTTERPIVITQETKEDALKELSQRAEQQKSTVPEVLPANLPMVESGEIVHDVPHVESKAEVELPKPEKPKLSMPVPDYRYPEGKDPYREPLN